MAGLTHLKDLYDTKGMEFIKNLFTKPVYATEKIDGSRFAVEKMDGVLTYFKRDGNTPINMVDRTVMSYYESAIAHMESLKLDSFPEGTRFGFEYFANNNPGSIAYDKIPKNGLILTDITKNGKTTTDIDELIKQAKILKTSPPPVIYNGKLSVKQTEQLEEFLLADWESLFTKFKTQSFTTYIISILNPKLKDTALNIGISKPIEGIVFSFDNGESFVHTKVVDPLYTQKARETAKGRYTDVVKDDNAKLKEIMKDILSYLKPIMADNIKLTANTTDLRYVELLSNLFYQYYESNKGKFKDVPAKRGDKIAELDVNYNLVGNPKLVKVLKSNEKVKNVYKTYLASFGKVRKRGNRILDKASLLDVNTLIPKYKKLSENNTHYYNLIENRLGKIITIFSDI